MMLRDCNLGKKVLVLVALVMLIGVMNQPAIAQTGANCIPEDATIDSATLSLYVTNEDDNTVDVHRITAPWEEYVVTWGNFGGAFDAFVEDSFLVDATGWVSADVTALVQDWLDGVYDNYGILLEQAGTPFTDFKSSEDPDPALRPKLEVCYTASTGSSCIAIQRPGAEQDGVADTHISEIRPDENHGGYILLRTGLGVFAEKQALIRFELCEEPPNGDGFCPGTPGYWKNRPEEWPVDTLVLGCETYTKAEMLVLFNTPTRGNASIPLAWHLIAAKLNILAGADGAPVDTTIADADSLLCMYSGKLPYDVLKEDKKQFTDLLGVLDDYNNGDLTPGCDDCEGECN